MQDMFSGIFAISDIRICIRSDVMARCLLLHNLTAEDVIHTDTCMVREYGPCRSYSNRMYTYSTYTLYIEAYLGFLGQVYRYADMPRLQASYATGDRDKVTAALEFPTFVPVPHIG
jgi:hypothetical protein